MFTYTTSELVRTNIPHRKEISDRLSYYTDIWLTINEMRRSIKFKVDTGSPYTIIGMDSLKKIGIKIDNKILMERNITSLNDASGNIVNIVPYKVDDFQLTDDISFEKIKIYLSSDITDRAVLGMDILSLFDFQYKHEKGNMLGTFWINNYKEHLQKINNILKRKNLDHLDTEQIFLLDEFEIEESKV